MAKKSGKKKEKEVNKEKKRIAVIRVRGKVHLREDISDTMKLMNLTRINHCVVVPSTPQYMGMINKAKDYITYGEISAEVMNKLLSKRGKLMGNKKLTDKHIEKNTGYKSIGDLSKNIIDYKVELKDVPNLKPVFRLRPPKKGYDRGGIKHPYSLGGALGYRGEKINELLERMI